MPTLMDVELDSEMESAEESSSSSGRDVSKKTPSTAGPPPATTIAKKSLPNTPPKIDQHPIKTLNLNKESSSPGSAPFGPLSLQ